MQTNESTPTTTPTIFAAAAASVAAAEAVRSYQPTRELARWEEDALDDAAFAIEDAARAACFAVQAWAEAITNKDVPYNQLKLRCVNAIRAAAAAANATKWNCPEYDAPPWAAKTTEAYKAWSEILLFSLL